MPEIEQFLPPIVLFHPPTFAPPPTKALKMPPLLPYLVCSSLKYPTAACMNVGDRLFSATRAPSQWTNHGRSDTFLPATIDCQESLGKETSSS